MLIRGGEFYVGETVYRYRDQNFTPEQRVGIGTVLTSAVEAYEASGKLAGIRVSEGDYVERGQLLFEMNGGTIAAGIDGIVTSVSARVGDTVNENQSIGEIAPAEALCVEIQVDETAAGTIRVGDRAEMIPAGQEDEEPLTGTVMEIGNIAESDQYTVRIRLDGDRLLPLGISVEVQL